MTFCFAPGSRRSDQYDAGKRGFCHSRHVGFSRTRFGAAALGTWSVTEPGGRGGIQPLGSQDVIDVVLQQVRTVLTSQAGILTAMRCRLRRQGLTTAHCRGVRRLHVVYRLGGLTRSCRVQPGGPERGSASVLAKEGAGVCHPSCSSPLGGAPKRCEAGDVPRHRRCPRAFQGAGESALVRASK